MSTDSADHAFNQVPAGTCSCGNAIYRRSASGVAPKRCTACRKALGSSGSKRGPRAAQHDTKGRNGEARGQVHDGPIIQMRKLMAGLPENLRPGGTALDVSCAAVALTGATGLPELIGEHIVETMQALIESGETGEDIRRRLNPSPFGRTAAQHVRRGGIHDYLEEATTR